MAFQTQIPKKEVRGTATVVSGDTTVAVSLTMPTASYVVLLTPDLDVGVFATGKTTTGFTVNLSASQTVDTHIDYIAKQI